MRLFQGAAKRTRENTMSEMSRLEANKRNLEHQHKTLANENETAKYENFRIVSCLEDFFDGIKKSIGPRKN